MVGFSSTAFFQQGVHGIDIPDTDCVGNADAISNAWLTVTQSAEFFREGGV